MLATELYDNGWTEIVPVAPPGSRVVNRFGIPIFETDKIGKIPSSPIANGDWQLIDAQDLSFTIGKVDAETWDKAGANLALRSRLFPVVDIDVLDKPLSDTLREITKSYLGDAPSRWGKKPKVGLVYRTDSGFRKRVISFDYKDLYHKVEFLGDGQVFNIWGKHPEGHTYEWDIDLPKPDELTTISEGDITGLIEELIAALQHIPGVQNISKPRIKTDDHPAEYLVAPSPAALTNALNHIPNNNKQLPAGRDDLLKMAYAIKGAAGQHEELGEKLFYDFAARWEEGDNPQDQMYTLWHSLKEPELGWANILYAAKQNPDFNLELVKNDFDTLPTEISTDIEQTNLPSAPAEASIFSSTGIADSFLNDFPDLVRLLNSPKATERQFLIRRKPTDSLWIRDERNDMRDAIRRYCVAQRERVFRLVDDPVKAAKTYSSMCSYDFQAKVFNQLITYSKINILPKDCDTDPDVINTPSGLISLRTGLFIEASESATYHTKLTSVTPDPRCPTPLFNEFLSFVTKGDVGLQRLLQKFMGYSATGRTIEQIFLFAYGDGQTGKGTFIRLMESVFGGYMTTVNSNVFLTRKGEPHPTEIADFQGMRLIVAQEFEDDAVWNEALLKSLTGSDTVKARKMHADFYSFTPTHTIFLAGNSLPSLRRVDHAIRRRVRLIPFMHVAPKELRDKNYEAQMKANELPGILQWVIDGAITWYKEGLGEMPTNVLTETDNYFESVDDLGIWLADNTVVDPEGFVSLAALHKPWTIFQRECGVVNVDSPRILGDKLQFRGYPRSRQNKARGHKGLRLIDKDNMETTLCSTCLGTGRVALNTKETV